MTGIFISYRREHTAAVVDRLHKRLADHFGERQIVRDVETVEPGDDFGQRIDQVVGSSDAFLAIISDRWLLDRNPAGKRPIGIARDWVQREIEVALRRPDVPVIPVLIEGAAMPDEQVLPYSVRSLANLRAMHLSDYDWDDQVAQLVKALEEVIGPPGSTRPALPGGALAGPAPAAEAPPPPASAARRWFRKG